MVRYAVDRALRSLVTVLATLAVAAVTSPWVAPAIVRWYLLLTVVALASLLTGRDRAWLVVLVLGSGSILVDHLVLNSPVTRLLDSTGTASSGVVLVLAWLGLYVAPAAGRPRWRYSG